MTLRLVPSDVVGDVAPGDPVRMLQEAAVVCRDQLMEAFERLAPTQRAPLQEALAQVQGVLQQLENMVVVQAFRSGLLDFRDGDGSRPTY